jgi:hypothetical protein
MIQGCLQTFCGRKITTVAREKKSKSGWSTTNYQSTSAGTSASPATTGSGTDDDEPE